MKFAPRNNRRALSGFRVATTLVIIAVLPFLLKASAPSWWAQRGVLSENAAPDDFSPANQGQLKNIARAAAIEMDARFAGGAGDEIHALIASWLTPGGRTNDFAVVNLGQLKSAAKPFYDRLIHAGLAETYPWLRSPYPADDFAVANVGQVKNLFSFDIPLSNILDDALADRLAAGEYSANLAIESQAVWIWGDHFTAATDFEKNLPRRVPGLSAVKSVGAGEHHLAALHNDGTVSTWGDNVLGQLGDGTNISRSAPSRVANLANIVSLKVGGSHTLALQQDGTLLAWGANYYGQLGTGDTNPSASPIAIPALTNVTKIAAGNVRSIALTADGSVWTWGYSHYDNGQDVYDTTPLLLPGLLDVVEIAAGYEHNVVVKSDGTVWVWGSNYSNQLGTGGPRFTYQADPVQVPALSGILKVATSYDHTLALARDGTVWAWGYNFSGQLGDGTNQQRQTPFHVAGLTDVIAIATAYNYSLAMKADGTVWAWGDFAPGILPGSNPRVPQQVGLGLFDSNQNGMDDRWELRFFSNLNQTGDADFDGDGVSNRLEYLRGTNPADYYNGVAPVIEIAGGNNQIGAPGTFLAKPFKVRVRNAGGAALVNAPVTFALPNGSGGLAISRGGAQQQAIPLRTDSNGEAFVYHALPDLGGISTRTKVTAGTDGILAWAFFRGISSLSPPPPITPTPNPSTTPSATPDPSATPTATPRAPYRYAIIDLGKDVYPIRINNQGWILVQGYDSNGDWGNFRWKSGNLEPLHYSGPNTDVTAVDMNDDGTVVGTFRNDSTWLRNKENEVRGGLVWSAGNLNAIKLSAPAAFSNFEPQSPGTFRIAELTAISGKGDAYGQACTGAVRGFLYHTILVNNALVWPGGAAPAMQLSFASATNVPPESFDSTWQGTSDTISRANRAGQYIGRKTTPFVVYPGLFRETHTGMINGQSADFDPRDLNEGGVVVGNKPSNGPFVIRALPAPPLEAVPDIQFQDSYPVALNDHTRPAPTPAAQSSPTAPPRPTPIPAPQVLGWTGSALVLWELQPNSQTWHPFGLEEMIPSMEGWDSLDPYDINDSGLIVGSGWYTDPSRPGTSSELHGFLMIPAELKVDANRDGSISAADAGLITDDNPYHFWVNDDNDSGDTGGNDVPGEGGNFNTVAHPDGTGTGIVDGTRDLIDFFALYLDIGPLLEIFPPTGPNAFTYNLKQEEGATNFVYTDLTARTASNYLRSLTGHGNDNALALGGTAETEGAVTHHITMEGAALDSDWLKDIGATGYGILLIEGRKPDAHPLVLEVYSSKGHRFAQIPLYLRLSSVEKMYRSRNLSAAGGGPGGLPDRLGNPENNPDELNNDKTFVMVHGYNVNAEQARGWGAEVFKRLYWSGAKAKFYNVIWFGSETQVGGTVTTDYQANVDNAFATAAEFAVFVKELKNVTVAAHSLGNMLVGSAIHDWDARPSVYFMIDAAVAKESYGDTEDEVSHGSVVGMEHPDWSPYDRRLWCSDWFRLFPTADHRSKLTWDDRLESVNNVLAYNFYSSGEEVLKNPTARPTFPLSASEVWNKQERMKGLMLTGQVLSSNYGGWQFNSSWDIPDDTAMFGAGRRRFPWETEEITAEQLKTNPFFKRGPNELFNENGSAYAAPNQHRNTLLAEMIPALSFAAGANRLAVRGDTSNFDMMDLKDGWPRANPDWRHSDMKIVAYVYIHRLYDELVELGGLR